MIYLDLANFHEKYFYCWNELVENLVKFWDFFLSYLSTSYQRPPKSKKNVGKYWNLFLFCNAVIQISSTYIVLHMFRQVLFWADNQNNHQNFKKSLLSYKLWLVFKRMKHFFFEKKIKNGRLKKAHFPESSILNIFRENFMVWSFG